MPAVFSRVERFARVGSTNDVVRGWLADGLPEVAVATADEQTAGRGRAGRTWTAPPGTSLLLSAGFRPAYLEPDATWLLGAIVAVAMAHAAEAVASLPSRTVALKWPNDLVLETGLGYRKLGGVLGETVGPGTADVRTVIGIGVNVDWGATVVPDELAATMTTLAAAADTSVSVDDLCTSFLEHLAGMTLRIRDGVFETAAWSERQVTTGRAVTLEMPGGHRRQAHAEGVDARSGALLISASTADGPPLAVHAAEVLHVRLVGGGV